MTLIINNKVNLYDCTLDIIIKVTVLVIKHLPEMNKDTSKSIIISNVSQVNNEYSLNEVLL